MIFLVIAENKFTGMVGSHLIDERTITDASKRFRFCRCAIFQLDVKKNLLLVEKYKKIILNLSKEGLSLGTSKYYTEINNSHFKNAVTL